MNSASTNTITAELPVLLRGEAGPINESIQRCTWSRVLLYLAVIVFGAACFGAAVGCWRAPLQALYTAIKFPLILMLTALGNALINGMLAPLLGLNINFRQSFVAVLMSFTIAAAILGAFSPVLAFLVWNTPMRTDSSFNSYSFVLLTQVFMIAFAGIAANFRLIQLLTRLSGSAAIARKILIAWLAVNLMLGAQLSWNLRPFVGSPGLAVQFVRPDALRGNFFEATWRSARNLISPKQTRPKPPTTKPK